jgi:hypothetical protein
LGLLTAVIIRGVDQKAQERQISFNFDSSSASRSLFFLNSSLYFCCSISCCLCLCSCKAACLSFAKRVFQTISTVPRCARASLYNAKVNQRHQGGGHCKSVAPDSGLADEFEDAEVSFVIKSQKRNSNG